MYLESSSEIKNADNKQGLVHKLAYLLAIVSKLDLTVAVLCLVTIVVLTSYGVITRYVLNAPSTWVEELCLALFVWMTFMGASALMRTDELVRIDLIVNKLSKPLRFLVDEIFRPILLIATICFIVYLGSKLIPYAHIRFTPALKISYVYIYSAVPISGVFMIYHQIVHLVNALKALKQE